MIWHKIFPDGCLAYVFYDGAWVPAIVKNAYHKTAYVIYQTPPNIDVGWVMDRAQIRTEEEHAAHALAL